MFVPWVTPWIHFGFLFGFGAPWATHLCVLGITYASGVCLPLWRSVAKYFVSCKSRVEWTYCIRIYAYKVLKSRSRGAQLRLTLGPSLKVQFRLAPSSEAQLRQEIPIEGRAVELDFGLVQDITYEMGGQVGVHQLITWRTH